MNLWRDHTRRMRVLSVVILVLAMYTANASLNQSNIKGALSAVDTSVICEGHRPNCKHKRTSRPIKKRKCRKQVSSSSSSSESSSSSDSSSQSSTKSSGSSEWNYRRRRIPVRRR